MLRKHLDLSNNHVLDAILRCKTIIEESIGRVSRFALEATGFRSERARLILEQCSNKSLLSSGFLRKLELCGARIRVVRPLLEFGADVHARDGLALVFATQSVDLEFLNIVISSNPTISSRRKAFEKGGTRF